MLRKTSRALLLTLLLASLGFAQTFVNSACWQNGSGGGSSSSINMSGANFFIIATSYFGTSPALTVSDSVNGSIYTKLTNYDASATGLVFHYAQNASSTSSMTFSVTGSSIFPGMCVLGFSGVNTSGSFQSGTDKGNIGNAATSQQPGSITYAANSVIVTALSDNNASDMITLTSATLQNSITFSSGVNEGCYIGYTIQSSSGSINPSWNGTLNGGPYATNIAAFSASGGGGSSHVRHKVSSR